MTVPWGAPAMRESFSGAMKTVPWGAQMPPPVFTLRRCASSLHLAPLRLRQAPPQCRRGGCKGAGAGHAGAGHAGAGRRRCWRPRAQAPMLAEALCAARSTPSSPWPSFGLAPAHPSAPRASAHRPARCSLPAQPWARPFGSLAARCSASQDSGAGDGGGRGRGPHSDRRPRT